MALSSTLTVPGAVLLAAARSGLPSPFRSPVATETGLAPAAKLSAALTVGGDAPGGVVFRSTLTTLLPLFATARSGLPSPSTSAIATACGAVPAAKLVAALKVGGGAPGGVV